MNKKIIQNRIIKTITLTIILVGTFFTLWWNSQKTEAQKSFAIEIKEQIVEIEKNNTEQIELIPQETIEKKEFVPAKIEVIEKIQEQVKEEKIEKEWIVRKKIITEQKEEKIVFEKINLAQDNFENQIEAAKAIQAQDETLFIEPNYTYDLLAITPNDTRFSEQWGLNNINGPKAWDFNRGKDTNGNSIIIAVIDTGVDINHKELKNNLWQPQNNICVDWSGKNIAQGCPNGGYDISKNDNNPYPDDGQTHGTHVAGIITATQNNNTGISGVAPNAKIMALRVCAPNASGRCIFTADNISKAIYFAANNGAKIINASFGGSAYSHAIEDAITYARNKGVLFIAAAGNSRRNNDKKPMYPANLALDNIMAIAAIDSRNNLASFSHWGKRTVDIAAPGNDILSLIPENKGGYKYMKGTSMATPHVSGIAALLLASNNNFSFLDIKNRIFKTGIETPNLKNKTVTGKRVNAYRALAFNITPQIKTIKLKDAFGEPLKEKLENKYLKLYWELEKKPLTSDKFKVKVKKDEKIIFEKELISTKRQTLFSIEDSGVYSISIVGQNEFGKYGNTKALSLKADLLKTEEENEQENITEELKPQIVEAQASTTTQESLISSSTPYLEDQMSASEQAKLLGIANFKPIEGNELETEAGTLSLNDDISRLIAVEDDGIYLSNPDGYKLDLDNALFIHKPQKLALEQGAGEMEALGTVGGLQHRGFCKSSNWPPIQTIEESHRMWEKDVKWNWNRGGAVCRENANSIRAGDYVAELVQYWSCLDNSRNFQTDFRQIVYNRNNRVIGDKKWMTFRDNCTWGTNTVYSATFLIKGSEYLVNNSQISTKIIATDRDTGRSASIRGHKLSVTTNIDTTKPSILTKEPGKYYFIDQNNNSNGHDIVAVLNFLFINNLQPELEENNLRNYFKNNNLKLKYNLALLNRKIDPKYKAEYAKLSINSIIDQLKQGRPVLVNLGSSWRGTLWKTIIGYDERYGEFIYLDGVDIRKRILKRTLEIWGVPSKNSIILSFNEIQGSDIRVANPSITPINLKARTNATISFKIKNYGLTNTDYFKNSVYLCSNPNCNQGAKNFLFSTVNKLNGKESINIVKNIFLNNWKFLNIHVNKEYYLVIIADENNSVWEKDYENNNIINATLPPLSASIYIKSISPTSKIETGKKTDFVIYGINLEDIKNITLEDVFTNKTPNQKYSKYVTLKNIYVPSSLAGKTKTLKLKYTNNKNETYEKSFVFSFLSNTPAPTPSPSPPSNPAPPSNPTPTPPKPATNYRFIDSSILAPYELTRFSKINFKYNVKNDGQDSQNFTKLNFWICANRYCTGSNKTKLSYIAINPIDAYRALYTYAKSKEIELKNYWKSWMDKHEYLHLVMELTQNNTKFYKKVKNKEYLPDACLQVGAGALSATETAYFDPTEDQELLNNNDANSFLGSDKDGTQALSADDDEASQEFEMGVLSVASEAKIEPADLEQTPEVIIDYKIKKLAKNLEYDPVKIYEYVQSNVEFVPYRGARKTASECLKSQHCNDIDIATTLIALYRASNIPAHYATGYMWLDANLVKKMLKVPNKKAAFKIISDFQGKDPFFYMHGIRLKRPYLDNSVKDFEKIIGLGWKQTWVEVYVEEDIYPKNPLAGADKTSQEVIDELQSIKNRIYSWRAIMPYLREYEISQPTYLAQDANFESDYFYENYLKGNFNDTPLSSIKNLLGIESIDNLIKIKPNNNKLGALPYSLPAIYASKQDTFSQIPDNLTAKFKISILTKDKKSVLANLSVKASIMQEAGIDIVYSGFNEKDKNAINNNPKGTLNYLFKQDTQNTQKENIYHPNLKTNIKYLNQEHSSNNSVLLGDVVVIKTDFLVGDELIRSDSKYSIAGANEGVFAYWGKIPLDYSNDIAPGLEGLTGLARQYAIEAQKDTQTIANIFGHLVIPDLGRVFVGENFKIKIDKIDKGQNAWVKNYSTDFAGLSMDVIAQTGDYSLFGDPGFRASEVRKLYELQASALEHDIFERFTSIDSISTVKALQVAHNAPDNAITVIGNENIDELDGLDFGDKITKRMRKDIMEGRTVITPVRPVVLGNWHGPAYIALDNETGEGRYYIGYNLQNGGWSVEQVRQFALDNVPGCSFPKGYWAINANTNGMEYFTYARTDPTNIQYSFTGKVGCGTLNDFIRDAKDEPGICNLAGAPINDPLEYSFGQVDHTLLPMSHGAKFSSNKLGYGFYEGYREIGSKIGNPFNYDLRAGTLKTTKNGSLEYFFTPNSNKGYVTTVKNRVLGLVKSSTEINKFLETKEVLRRNGIGYSCKSRQTCISPPFTTPLSYLGYPVSNETEFSDSILKKNIEQRFVGGSAYVINWGAFGLLNSYYYTLGNVNKDYQDIGYPISLVEPAGGNNLIQSFSNGKSVQYGIGNRNIAVNTIFDEKNSIKLKSDSKEYLNGMNDGLKEIGLSAVAIAKDTTADIMIAAVTAKAAEKGGKKSAVKFALRSLPAVGWALTGITAVTIADDNKETLKYCLAENNRVFYGKNPDYYCGKLTVRGIFLSAGVVSSGFYKKIGVNPGANIKRILDYDVMDHAYNQMIKRKIKLEDVEDIIKNGKSIQYNHEGLIKKGFYIEDKKIFIATYEKRILTIMKTSTSNKFKKYINNLKNK